MERKLQELLPHFTIGRQKELPLQDYLVAFKYQLSEKDYITIVGNDWEEFETAYFSLSTDLRRFNEIIREDYPFQEFYDIDYKVCDLTMDEIQFEAIKIVKDLVHYRNETFFPSVLNINNFVILTSHRLDKISIHLISNNSYHRDMKLFKRQVATFADKIQGLDLGVYSKNRLFRILGSTKFGEVRPLISDNQYGSKVNLKNSLVAHFEPKGSELTTGKVYNNVQRMPAYNPTTTDNVPSFDEMQMFLDWNRDLSHDFDTWNQVVWSIWNIYNGSLTAEKLIHYFSKLSSKYDDYKVQNWINSLPTPNGKGFRFKNLYRITKSQQAKDFLQTFLKKDYYSKGQQLLDHFDHHNLARFVAEIFDGEIYYTTSHKWVCWFPEKHKWEAKLEPDSLSKKIYDAISEPILEWIENQTEKEVAKIGKSALKSLGNHSFKIGIIKDLKPFVSDDNIISKFNSKINLFCFSNGMAYDLDKHQIVKIQKEDFVFTTTNYPLPERKESDIQFVYEFIKTVFMTHKQLESNCQKGLSLVDSWLSSASLYLYGKNRHEYFIVWTGKGGNGKGVCRDILEQVLTRETGYYQEIDGTQILAVNRTPDKANSELAKCSSARLVMTAEVEDSEEQTTLKTEIIKKWTGNDSISCRFLGQQSFSYKPQFTLTLQSNLLPKVSKNDEAFERRFKNIPFPISFRPNNGQELEEFEKFRDEKVKNEGIPNDPRYRDGMFWLLVDFYKKYKGAFYESQQVKESTKLYLKQQNIIYSWMTENYIVSETSFLSCQEIYNHWVQDHPYHKLILSEFGKKLTKLYEDVKDKTRKASCYKLLRINQNSNVPL